MSSISDEELYHLCQQYGTRALAWRRKFVGLLPEVNRRRLFSKKGFYSIFEFAAKLGGVSEDQVRLALNLEGKFTRLPRLKKALVKGEISLSKLSRVASVATEENEEELVEQIRVLPKRAVEQLARDMRGVEQANRPLQLDADVERELQVLQEKGIDVNQFLREALKERENRIEDQKATFKVEETASRHIPIRVRRMLAQEYGQKCAIGRCSWPAKEVHHAIPFSMHPNHDPRFLLPLCREHHALAHAVNRRVCEKRQAAVQVPRAGPRA